MPKRGRPQGTGKPRKLEAEVRSEVVSLRLTPGLLDAVYREARRRGKTGAALMREGIYSVVQQAEDAGPDRTLCGEGS